MWSLFGTTCGGRAVGWTCVPHIDWFMIQRFVGDGISPTPRREVAATHAGMVYGERCQASGKVWLPLASLGLLRFGLRHHPDGSWIPSCGSVRSGCSWDRRSSLEKPSPYARVLNGLCRFVAVHRLGEFGGHEPSCDKADLQRFSEQTMVGPSVANGAAFGTRLL